MNKKEALKLPDKLNISFDGILGIETFIEYLYSHGYQIEYSPEIVRDIEDFHDTEEQRQKKSLTDKQK